MIRPSLHSVFIAKKQDIDFHEFDKGETKDIVKYLERILGLTLQGKIERPIENITKSIEADIQFMMDADGDYVNEVQNAGNYFEYQCEYRGRKQGCMAF